MLVVVAQLHNQQLAFQQLIHHSMLIRDSTRPAALKGMLKRLGFSNAAMRIAQCVFDKLPDTCADSRIGLLPIQVVLPPLGGERDVHSSRLIFFRMTLPLLIASIESSRRFAFAGERRR